MSIALSSQRHSSLVLSSNCSPRVWSVSGLRGEQLYQRLRKYFYVLLSCLKHQVLILLIIVILNLTVVIQMSYLVDDKQWLIERTDASDVETDE